jgi:hypothetical protein
MQIFSEIPWGRVFVKIYACVFSPKGNAEILNFELATREGGEFGDTDIHHDGGAPTHGVGAATGDACAE